MNIKINYRCCNTLHAIFLPTIQRIWMFFFSLKHFAYQGESSLKISACWSLPSWGT